MATAHVTGLHSKKISSAVLVPAVQSTLLLFCTIFPLFFLTVIFHEGGHALMDIANGGQVDLFYVHPFSFNGYVRPISSWQSIEFHVAGGLFGLIAALVIFPFAWKHRSISMLSVVMVFPWTAILLGLQIMPIVGDWRNIVQLTGMPEFIMVLTGGLLLLVGICLFVSTFPLLGLTPENKRSLIVIPAGFALWSVFGLAIGYIFVPGSTVDVKYGLMEEILSSANVYPFIGLGVGFLLAGIYVTLYRLVYWRLPAGFRLETASLTCDHLRIPGMVAAACVILGLLIIR